MDKKETIQMEQSNNPSDRICFSVEGEVQETPEQLIARGEGSDKPSVCQKL